MPIFVLFVSAGVLFDGAFSLWVSLNPFSMCKPSIYHRKFLSSFFSTRNTLLRNRYFAGDTLWMASFFNISDTSCFIKNLSSWNIWGVCELNSKLGISMKGIFSGKNSVYFWLVFKEDTQWRTHKLLSDPNDMKKAYFLTVKMTFVKLFPTIIFFRT